MGGWVVRLGTSEPFEAQAARFRRIFSAPGVPPLQVDATSYGDRCHVLRWAWASVDAPLVALARSQRNGRALLLDGYLTSLGKYGMGSASQEENVARLVDEHRVDRDRLIEGLNGSFSCLFLDPAAEEATVYTDRIASRPVWALHRGDAWYIGNYPAAIAAMQRDPLPLDPAGLWSLFLSSRHVGRRGLYRGLLNLHGGECATYKTGAAEAGIRSWHRRQYAPEHGRTAREWSSRIADELQAVAWRLKKSFPHPHLFLSGGLDSRIAAGAFADKTRTVTLTSTENNFNARVAENVARTVGASHQTLLREPYWYLDTFEAAALMGGGNYNLRHAHFTVPVPLVREHVPDAAFLLGDLLENFNKPYFKAAADERTTFIPEQVPDLFPDLYSYMHPDPERMKRLFQPKWLAAMTEGWREELVALCRSVEDVSEDARDCYDTLFRWHNCSLCPTYLMLESIRPLADECNLMFDNEMLALYHAIPRDVRGQGVLHPWTLWHLKKRLVLMSTANYWMPPIVPDGVKKLAATVRPVLGKTRRAFIRRAQGGGPVIKTEGSWHMLSEWYRTDERHRAFIEDCLFDEACLPPDIFNIEEVRALWEAFTAEPGERVYHFEIDMLITFGLLHRRIPSTGLAE